MKIYNLRFKLPDGRASRRQVKAATTVEALKEARSKWGRNLALDYAGESAPINTISESVARAMRNGRGIYDLGVSVFWGSSVTFNIDSGRAEASETQVRNGWLLDYGNGRNEWCGGVRRV